EAALVEVAAVQRLLRRRDRLAAHPGGRELHGLEDLDGAGAAAEVAGESLLDLATRRLRVLIEEGARRQQEPGRAVAALRRAESREGFLERMQARGPGHPLDGLDRPALALEAQDEAREDRLSVDQHGARAALAELAAVLGARQVHVLAQDLEQRLVRGERGRDTLAVAAESNFRAGRGRLSRFRAASHDRRM